MMLKSILPLQQMQRNADNPDTGINARKKGGIGKKQRVRAAKAERIQRQQP